MGWLALAVACSLAIAVIFKFGEGAGFDRVALMAVNYIVAFGLAMLLAGGTLPFGSDALTLLGVSMGALYITGFIAFALAIRSAGMALAASTMRLAVAIPVLAGWLIWAEVPSLVQLVGLLVAGAAFLLITRPNRSIVTPVTGVVGTGPVADERGAEKTGHTHVIVVLAFLFVAGGIVDVLKKTFNESFGLVADRAGFLALAFGAAFILGVLFIVARGLTGKGWPTWRVVPLGAVLGLVNYGSADFMLRAIAVLPAPVVFPVNNLAVVMGAALIGVLGWGEHLSRANVGGLILAGIALVLLTI
ncbi:DMT family transporter [soil metagenome]